MPRRPNIPCKHPGCAALIPHGQMYCEEHKPLHTKDRAHAAERGYGAKWQRERRKFLESMRKVISLWLQSWIISFRIVETRNSSGIVGTGSLYVSIIIM